MTSRSKQLMQQLCYHIVLGLTASHPVCRTLDLQYLSGCFEHCNSRTEFKVCVSKQTRLAVNRPLQNLALHMIKDKVLSVNDGYVRVKGGQEGIHRVDKFIFIC